MSAPEDIPPEEQKKNKDADTHDKQETTEPEPEPATEEEAIGEGEAATEEQQTRGVLRHLQSLTGSLGWEDPWTAEEMEMPEREQPVGKKSFVVALLLSIFLGALGMDRFYLEYTWLGILKLLTLGFCGIWYLIDIIMIATGNMRDAEGNKLRR